MPLDTLVDTLVTVRFPRQLRAKEMTKFLQAIVKEVPCRITEFHNDRAMTIDIRQGLRNAVAETTDIEAYGKLWKGEYQLNFRAYRSRDETDLGFDGIRFSNHHPWESIDQIPVDTQKLLKSIQYAAKAYFAVQKATSPVPAIS